ncbi:uncharacterized protein IWZ02DRAFT_149431 [Phyllosticta citriasiana]|uniref:uncharacterized protein n=1 Tax=Phyllosticta citriasiana TaxID=595635 RepID=UPI0030FD83F4
MALSIFPFVRFSNRSGFFCVVVVLFPLDEYPFRRGMHSISFFVRVGGLGCCSVPLSRHSPAIFINHHLFLFSSLLLHLAFLFRVGLVCDATYFPTCLSACLRRLSIGCWIPSSSPFLVLNNVGFRQSVSRPSSSIVVLEQTLARRLPTYITC